MHEWHWPCMIKLKCVSKEAGRPQECSQKSEMSFRNCFGAKNENINSFFTISTIPSHTWNPAYYSHGMKKSAKGCGGMLTIVPSPCATYWLWGLAGGIYNRIQNTEVWGHKIQGVQYTWRDIFLGKISTKQVKKIIILKILFVFAVLTTPYTTGIL